MHSAVVVVLGIAGMSFGWFVYSRFIATQIFRLDPGFVTPAHELKDGADYVPTNRYVLWGHHFTSVAGAAPIVGPAIAVYWGWVPAVTWVVLGTVFFAGVHDFGALWASNRHQGRSIGALSESVVGRRCRTLYMIIVFLVLLMVNSVFGVVIAGAFVATPGAVLPAWAAIIVAAIVGQLVYRRFNLVMLGIGGVAVLYWSIHAGSTMPLALPVGMFNMTPEATWIVILFVYAAVASMLPVWALLQPRDFINGMQLLVGLVLLYGAVFLLLPEISAPAFNRQVSEEGPPILPLLFVTIACGAVSGFHGIVASGTSSKQLDKETDARFVGYLSAVGEGSLALITIVVVSGVTLAATPEAWHVVYDEFGAAGASAFISGGANLIAQGWGIPAEFAQTMLATMVVLFAGTTMDSGVRLQRYIIQEWSEIYHIPVLKNGAPATLLAVGACLLLAFAGSASGDGGTIIWPLFGSTNQILAGMTLLVLSVMLFKLGRPVWYTMLPMLFVFTTSFLAACVTLIQFYRDGNLLLMVLDLIVLVTSLMVMLEAGSAVVAFRQTPS